MSTEKTNGVDLTPTWRGILPGMIAVLEHGTDKGKDIARDELARMAKAADQWNAHCKAEEAKQGVSA